MLGVERGGGRRGSRCRRRWHGARRTSGGRGHRGQLVGGVGRLKVAHDAVSLAVAASGMRLVTLQGRRVSQPVLRALGIGSSRPPRPTHLDLANLAPPAAGARLFVRPSRRHGSGYRRDHRGRGRVVGQLEEAASSSTVGVGFGSRSGSMAEVARDRTYGGAGGASEACGRDGCLGSVGCRVSMAVVIAWVTRPASTVMMDPVHGFEARRGKRCGSRLLPSRWHCLCHVMGATEGGRWSYRG